MREIDHPNINREELNQEISNLKSELEEIKNGTTIANQTLGPFQNYGDLGGLFVLPHPYTYHVGSNLCKRLFDSHIIEFKDNNFKEKLDIITTYITTETFYVGKFTIFLYPKCT